MAGKEPGAGEKRPASSPGLMTRGRMNKLQGQPSPTNAQAPGMDAEGFTSKIKASMSAAESDQYGKMMGSWFPQQMWPPGMRMDPSKMMQKQGNFFMPPMPHVPPNFPPQMGSGMPTQMPGQVGQMGQTPGQMPPMGQMMGPPGFQGKMPPMMMSGMRGMPFQPKGPQSPSRAKMPQMMIPGPNMAMGYQPMYSRVSPKSPSYIRHNVIKSRMPKTAGSPKNMEAFLSDTIPKEEKIDLNLLLREEITKILNQEIDRLNDLHTDNLGRSEDDPGAASFDNYFDANTPDCEADLDSFNEHPEDYQGDDGAKEVNTSKRTRSSTSCSQDKSVVNGNVKYSTSEKRFRYADLDSIIDVLIEGFRPVLQLMWTETKKYHKYSLDETYHAMVAKEQAPEVKPKRRKKSKDELVVVRDFEGLKSLFQKRDEIERLMASYRNNSRTFTQNYFMFSSFNSGFPQGPSSNSEDANGEEGEQQPTEITDPWLKKAIEYADVASNQRLLLNNVTSLDLRSALAGDVLASFLPTVFRQNLTETVTSLHFDLGTPPQLSPRLTKQAPEQDLVLNKVYDTLQSFQSQDVSQVSKSSTSSMTPTFPPQSNMKLNYNRDERLKELMNKPGGVNKNFNLPPGVNLFPNLQPTLPAPLGPNMPNVRGNLMGSGKITGKMAKGGRPKLQQNLPHNMGNTMGANMATPLPQGVNIAPNLPPNMPPNMGSNMPPNLMGPGHMGANMMPQNVNLHQGANGFNMMPGVMQPQMVMPNQMPPHISTNNQFFNNQKS